MTENAPILKIKKRKSKLEAALSNEKKRIKIGCIFAELYAFKPKVAKSGKNLCNNLIIAHAEIVA